MNRTINVTEIRRAFAVKLMAGDMLPMLSDIDNTIKTLCPASFKEWRGSDERFRLKANLLVLAAMAGSTPPADLQMDEQIAGEFRLHMKLTKSLQAGQRAAMLKLLKGMKK
jgi:hypothetical protein